VRPQLVTLHLWRVPRRRIGAALGRVAVDRFAVRRAPGALFSRVLGTGAGRTFSVRDAQPDRWALLVAWASAEDAVAFERSAVVRGWTALAHEHWRADLLPLAAHGRWSGRSPFGAHPAGRAGAGGPVAGPASAAAEDAVSGGLQVGSPVAALTRARLRLRVAGSFWRAVPPVAAELAGQQGLRLALGIGERPVGVQGTFSLWDSAEDLDRFAYAGPAHLAAIEGARARGWFAEALFARFAVVASTGTVDGRDPLGGGWSEHVAAAQ
jgi:heme-degrading monooxygenase HmoA